MRYEDRTPNNDVNTPDRHPLREFLRLSVMGVAAIFVIGFFLSFLGSSLGGHLPFTAEVWVTERLHAATEKAGQDSMFEQNADHPELQGYLQSIANQVTTALDVEKPMQIHLHYKDEDMVNAYATIGGHVYFFKGLLTLLPHENALAMLIAHEYSHVTLRHPAKGLGGGLALAIGTSALGLSSDNGLFSLGGRLTSTRFSRTMETEADKSALTAVNEMYGHVNGTAALFELFMDQRSTEPARQFEKFVSTHPLDQQRIENIDILAREYDWHTEGEVTPLPDEFGSWLQQSSGEPLAIRP